MAKEVKVAHHYYINNVFSAFIRGLSDFLKTEWFNARNQDVIISTYEKAVEHIRNRKNNAGEKFQLRFPFITINPEMDFEPDEQMGRFYHGFPIYKGYSTYTGSTLYNPLIYEDDNISIAPVLNRYKGTMEVIMWASSIYELMDFKFFAMQFFGGFNRPIYPASIDTFITMPDELLYYSTVNPHTQETYTLDWEGNSTEARLIKSINKNKLIYPFSMQPYIKLTSASDGSEKYGGSSDEIGNHRLVLNLEWETNLPSHLVLVAEKLPEMCHNILFDLECSSHYIKTSGDDEELESIRVPYELVNIYSNWSAQDTTSTEQYSVELLYDETYLYNITEEDYNLINADDIQPENKRIEIELPKAATSCDFLRVFGTAGKLFNGIHWTLEDEQTIVLFGFNLINMEVDDPIIIVFYEENL